MWFLGRAAAMNDFNFNFRTGLGPTTGCYQGGSFGNRPNLKLVHLIVF